LNAKDDPGERMKFTPAPIVFVKLERKEAENNKLFVKEKWDNR
jgi:hypothetical protein